MKVVAMMKKDVQQRKMTNYELKKLDAKERQDLKQEYKDKLATLKAEQAERQRRTIRPTSAGGWRRGSGRPSTTPHNPLIVAGEDLNPRKTYTFYGAADEVPTVRYFLKVWRDMRFNTLDLWAALSKLKGETVYKLLTGLPLEPAEERKVKKLLPYAHQIYGEYRSKFENKTDNQSIVGNLKSPQELKD
jgi:hypothetical protein